MVKCLQNNYFRQFSAACCYLLYRASVPPKKPARSKSVPALYTIKKTGVHQLKCTPVEFKIFHSDFAAAHGVL
jgi:hypothetical protein